MKRSVLVLITAMASTIAGCSQRGKSDGADTDAKSRDSSPTPAAVALANSAHLSGAKLAHAALAVHEAELAVQGEDVVVRASGNDPQLLFRIATAPAAPCAVRIQIDAPAATQLELFYEADGQPMSAERAARCALEKGSNAVLLQINDPRFDGGVRLDPGQLPGDYVVHGIEAFAQQSVRFLVQNAAQEQVAAEFEACGNVAWSAKNPDGFSQIRASGDAQTSVGEGSMQVKATGADPRLELPAVLSVSHAVVKVVLTAPTATVVQCFYRNAARSHFDEAHSVSHEVPAGESTTYLEIDAPEGATELRFDPGTVEGDYVLKELEIRTCPPRESGA